MTELGAAEQRINTPQRVYDTIADDLLLGRLIADNQLILAPPDYEAGLPEKTGDRPGENIGAQDWAVPLAMSFLTVGMIATGTAGLASLGGRAAISAAARSGVGRIFGLPLVRKLPLTALGSNPAMFGLLPAVAGFIAEQTDEDKSAEELAKDAEEQLKKDLIGPIQSSAEPTPEMTEDGLAMADYAMLAELGGLNQNNFRTQMPLFYGNIKLTDKGMFAESEAADIAGQAILEGIGEKAELDQYIVPPLASSAGRTLGAMTVRWYDIYAPISEQTRQAGLGSVDQPGRPRQGVFYEEEQIGEEQIIGREMLAPGEELPEAPLGRRYEEREAEMDYGIDDALAYYDALSEEEQHEFAVGLVALGYMGTGKQTTTIGDTEWLVNPDAALQRDAVAIALDNAAQIQGIRVQAEAGTAGMKGIDSTNPLRNQYLPILGYEGGLFDTEEAVIEDWDLFVQEAREKAGYITAVPVAAVTKETNDWAFRMYGRSATMEEVSNALNTAGFLSESQIGPQPISPTEIVAGATGSLALNEGEASQNATALINSALGNYIIRNSRGLVR